LLTARASRERAAQDDRGGWRERRRLRRRLAAQDDLSAQTGELMRIVELAAAAQGVVRAGWAQNAWYVRQDGSGRSHAVGLGNAHDLDARPAARACLVGAILQAGGGLATAGTQRVQRTFDLAWHTLHRGNDEPVRWCPGPQVRAQQLRDLVGWNDEPGRSAAEVMALLGAVGRAADREAARNRERLGALV